MLRVLLVLVLLARDVEASFGLHPNGRVGNPMCAGPSHLPAERILVQRRTVSASHNVAQPGASLLWWVIFHPAH